MAATATRCLHASPMSVHPVHVRQAIVADAAAIAQVHVESSEEAYAPLAEAWTPGDVEERARQWGLRLAAPPDGPWFALVAERDGAVAGFIGALGGQVLTFLLSVQVLEIPFRVAFLTNTIAVLIAYSVLCNSTLAMAVTLAWSSWYLLAPFAEEPWLRERLGVSFEAYTAQVPRYLSPTVWRAA